MPGTTWANEMNFGDEEKVCVSICNNLAQSTNVNCIIYDIFVSDCLSVTQEIKDWSGKICLRI